MYSLVCSDLDDCNYSQRSAFDQWLTDEVCVNASGLHLPTPQRQMTLNSWMFVQQHGALPIHGLDNPTYTAIVAKKGASHLQKRWCHSFCGHRVSSAQEQGTERSFLQKLAVPLHYLRGRLHRAEKNPVGPRDGAFRSEIESELELYLYRIQA